MSYERLFRHVLFPAFDQGLKRRGTITYLREYEAGQWLDAQALARLQLEKLNRLLEHCWRTVPYLRDRWTAEGLDDRPLAHVGELARYPVTDKDEITANYAAMISSEWRGRTASKATGGSTGSPFRFEFTPESDARRNAVMWRGYRWAGADIGRRAAFLWGTGFGGSASHRAKDWLYHRAFNRVVLNAFQLTERNAGEFADAINRFRPAVIVGYVTPLVTLAELALKEHLTLHQPVSVITGAEGLSESQREVIAGVFRCPVFNTYGSREFMLIAAECERQRGLHTSADHLVVETLNEQGAVVVDEPGDVVITDLHNFGMPFVRYRNGDLATRATRRCDCGRGLPLLERIDGRKLDMIRSPDGRMLPGEFFPHLMKEFEFVRQFQVVQREPGAVEIALVGRGDVTEEGLARMRHEIAAALGQRMRVDLQLVQDIPLTPSGKRRVTVSLLDTAGVREPQAEAMAEADP